ncbi:beta-aspartyl-peptidase (threonine type) [Fontimonas thermophila]|uniref:Isoaspartyl peptidase n=1 Tax=Fontimonas thermophila TaxID=1076937 RepID=A0A1I2K0S3_9GAMM|nr:isoaspartyl peptidase/L-asparaginase [Fontimonas thermophila]SFF59943.1 beta-aspartyl-peptidase (threonine type) [Fontimonas thermophila]
MIRLAIHGGAGDLAADQTDTREHRAALRRIAEEGRALLQAGASSLDVVERMVVRLEDCPLFNAGIGAVLNRDGMPELDAAIMDGRTRACGAVAGVMRVKNPVRLARAVMERSPHVMFMGSGAEALNRELGLDEVTPDYFITEERFRQLKQAHARGVIVLDHEAAFTPAEPTSGGFGTVGAVARDAEGRLAAATSTGGLTNKHPGRIGDTPLIGAGTFADDRSAAVSCTGTGECFIRVGFGFEVHARMSYCNWTLERACREALEDVRRLGGRGGCIAIDHEGNLALPFNSTAMYRAWMGADGVIHVGIGTDDVD